MWFSRSLKRFRSARQQNSIVLLCHHTRNMSHGTPRLVPSKLCYFFYPVPNYIVELLMQWCSCRFIACTSMTSAFSCRLYIQSCALDTHEELLSTHPTTTLKTSADGTGGTASLLSPHFLLFLAATAHCKCWQSHYFPYVTVPRLNTQYSFHSSVLLSSVEEGWPKQDEKWVVG